ncbi:MAG: ABC transporter ATP-binding protein [Hyphomicrobiales bacterium]|nr:ABC transporter ATP-binding protein [Hyphomicrobiales bacterium]
MSLLEVEHLAVEHGRMRALWDVSLTVSEGERVGLLGADGAGKSTTLGAIIGLYPPIAGAVRYDGSDIAHRSVSDIIGRRLALVPEGRRLFPEMTVRENLEMGAYVASARKSLPHQLDSVLDLFPILREKAAQRAGALSGGQQQMVAIGRALMSAPRLLLLDEPFIGVAPLVVEEVMSALRRIVDEGVTVLLVEQNIHRALDFVERAYVMENGRIVLAGTKDELLADAAFGSKFLGLD